MKNNCTCAICGKGYYVCLPCSKPETNTWKLHTCTTEHYKVYSVIHGYSSGIYTKKETYDNEGQVNPVVSFSDGMYTIINNDTGEVLAAATYNPARSINMPEYGNLAKGRPADIFIFDNNVRVQKTFCQGKLVYSAS